MDFQSVLLDLGLSYVFDLLGKIPKNESAKRKYKNVMLKIASKIFAAYKGDDDFESMMNVK